MTVTDGRPLGFWRVFMNGYRDPRTQAALNAQAEARAEFEGYGWGGGDSGGSGERECGYRKEGGTYAEIPLARRGGKPLEHFLVCPPVKIDPAEYNLSNVGVRLVDLPERCLTCNGSGETVPRHILESDVMDVAGLCSDCGGLGLVPVTHVFDIVGEENYPNVADFLEEARRLGVSRRLELSDAKEYARLTSRSKLILLHRRAVLDNPMELLYKMGRLELSRLKRADCPKYHAQHTLQLNPPDLLVLPPPPHSPGCAALHWHLIEGGEVVPERAAGDEPERTSPDSVAYRVTQPFRIVDAPGTPLGKGIELGQLELEQLEPDCGRFVERRLASGTYRGYCPPEGFKPAYSLGIFAIFPLVRLTVIDPDGQYQDRVERASASSIDVSVEEC